MTRHRRVARLLVAAIALVVGAAAGGGLFPDGSAAAAACGPAPTGRVAVAVVVDGPGGISSRCITVAEGAKGAEALVAAGHSIRSEGGFVCGIDGQPATGCAVNSQTAPYWSYWHAPPGGSWSYSGVGAFSHRLPARCAVEGWRLVDPGMPRGQAVPRASPAVECAAPAPPPPAPAPAGPSAPAPAAPAPGSPASADGAPAAGPVSGPNAPPSGPAGSASPAPTVAGAGTVAPATSAPAPGPDDPAASTTTSEGGATTGVEDGSTDDGEAARPDRSPGETAEASSPPAAAGTSRGSPVGAASVLAVLVALGVVALVRRRRAVVRGTGQAPLTHNST